MALPECWLWAEGTQIRWWSPQDTGLLTPEILARGEPPNISALRSGARQLALRALTNDWRELLQRLFEDHSEVRLRLADDLPESCQHFPFEYLSDRDILFTDRLQVVRYVPKTADPPRLLSLRSLAIVDLWPDHERGDGLFENVFEALDTPAIDSKFALTGLEETQAWCRDRDLSALSLLCVIAHGSGSGDQPFRPDDRRSWALPLDNGLPSLVSLLICGDEEHEIWRYGRRLLKSGAHAVLAPTGPLDAPSADKFCRRFLRDWLGGASIEDTLWQARRTHDSEFAARRLQLLGRGNLRLGPVRSVSDVTTDTLVARAATESAALHELVERITLRCYQNDGGLDGAVDELYECLEIDYGERDDEAPLCSRLDACEANFSPLTRSWVLPYLVYLAEAYDQRLLPKYEAIRSDRRRLPRELLPAPYVYHYWSKLYYRRGRYVQATEELAKGFVRINPTRITKRSGIGLLGQLVNILIDLDLPESGARVYDQLEACLDRADGRFTLVQRANRLDRRARLALRQGAPDRAVPCYQNKREIDQRDPERDLAWLLYAAAWGDQAHARNFGEEVEQLLAKRTDCPPAMDDDDKTTAYLLRAYALWAWRANDAAAARWLAPRLATRAQRLAGQDPGAIGLALGYLWLYVRNNPAVDLELPRWAVMEEALEREGYWFELAVLNSLLARTGQARRDLQRFQAMRSQAVAFLEHIPGWLGGLEAPELHDHVTRRCKVENAILLADHAPAIAELVKSGLMPL